MAAFAPGPAGSLGYAQITGNFTTTSTTYAYVTSLGVAVTIPAGGRSVRITGYTTQMNISAVPKQYGLAIFSGASVGTLTTQLNSATAIIDTTSNGNPVIVQAVVTPAAGAISYSLGCVSDGGGGVTTTVVASSTAPAFILVEGL